MSQTVSINFDLDRNVNQAMEQVCSDLGISTDTAFTIFATKVGRERRIPFDLYADPFYSESNMRHIDNILKDIEEGRAHFAEHDLIEVG